jgi:hypothetical protein
MGKMKKQILSPRSAPVLESLQWQGQRNDCGPFTTATVINALTGSLVKAADLAELMNKPAWRGPMFVIRRVPNWATFPWGMADVFRQYGLKAKWGLFTRTSKLLKYLEQGQVVMPMIGAWKPMWAHVMTLVAHDPQKGWGFANTQYDTHDIFWLDDATFTKQWKAMGHLLVRVEPEDVAPKTPDY